MRKEAYYGKAENAEEMRMKQKNNTWICQIILTQINMHNSAQTHLSTTVTPMILGPTYDPTIGLTLRVYIFSLGNIGSIF